jgi:hypothetical protein
MATTTTTTTPSPSPESREQVLLQSLLKYYAVPENLRTLTDVLRNKTKISLRSIDWLVTNWAKKNNTHLVVGDKTINLYLEYKSGLKAYSKRAFDPFQRRGRVSIVDADGAAMTTTVGQLNFFKFAIQNGVIDFALQNASVIEADMLKAIRHRAVDASGSFKAKRKELSRAAIKTATSTSVKVTVRFM